MFKFSKILQCIFHKNIRSYMLEKLRKTLYYLFMYSRIQYGIEVYEIAALYLYLWSSGQIPTWVSRPRGVAGCARLWLGESSLKGVDWWTVHNVWFEVVPLWDSPREVRILLCVTISSDCLVFELVVRSCATGGGFELKQLSISYTLHRINFWMYYLINTIGTIQTTSIGN